jgi:hypothetical protein
MRPTATRLDILTARRIALQLRCDPRTVAREWRHPGSVRGMLGELLRPALAELRARPPSMPAAPGLGCDLHHISARERADT